MDALELFSWRQGEGGRERCGMEVGVGGWKIFVAVGHGGVFSFSPSKSRELKDQENAL